MILCNVNSMMFWRGEVSPPTAHFVAPYPPLRGFHPRNAPGPGDAAPPIHRVFSELSNSRYVMLVMFLSISISVTMEVIWRLF
jgi:hypothetical protein